MLKSFAVMLYLAKWTESDLKCFVIEYFMYSWKALHDIFSSPLYEELTASNGQDFEKKVNLLWNIKLQADGPSLGHVFAAPINPLYCWV